MTVAIALGCLVVIGAGIAGGIWIALRAMKANEAIYNVRRRELEEAGRRPPRHAHAPRGTTAEFPAGSDQLIPRTSPMAAAGEADVGAEQAVQPSHRSQSATDTLVRIIIAAYAGLWVAGFLVGYFLATGTQGKRLGIGLLGALGAGVLVAVAINLVRVGNAVRTAVRDRSK